jgi:hypothetical protein
MDDFADLALRYRPPPEPLRLATRRPTAAAETIDADSHVERVLQAFATVAAECGYANTTIELVQKRASMSPDHLLRPLREQRGRPDGGDRQRRGAAGGGGDPAGFWRHQNWAHGVRAAYEAFFDFLTSRPALARLVAVEVYAAGPAALERREEALRPLEVLLADGRAPKVPRIVVETIAGGATPWPTGRSATSAPRACRGWRRSAPTWRWRRSSAPWRPAP